MDDQEHGGVLTLNCKPNLYLNGIDYLVQRGFKETPLKSRLYQDLCKDYRIGFKRENRVDIEVEFGDPLWPIRTIRNGSISFNNDHPCLEFLRGLYLASGGESVLDLEAQVMDPNPFE